MWGLLRDPHFRKRRDERPNQPSRDGRLRWPLLEGGGLLGGGCWFATTHSSSTGE
jgi:hypothetical protein